MQKFHVYVRNGYIGTVFCTLAEVRATFPRSEIVGSRVDVFAVSRR